MPDDYTYRITEVVKIVDGDTYHLRVEKKVDVGFHLTMTAEAHILVRLLNYDCPERSRGSEFERLEAKRATSYAADYFRAWAGQLFVRTEKDDDFGRWLGDIWADNIGERMPLGGFLRERRLASVWPRRWRDEFDQAGAA